MSKKEMILTEVEQQTTEQYDLIPPFEPLYELIKTDKHAVWFYFNEKMNKLIGWLGCLPNLYRNIYQFSN